MAGSNSITKTLVWILMGLLILGLGGFGVTNLSGTARNVGTVGDTDIELQEYARTLQREIRALQAERGEPVSFAQARAEGIDQAVLGRLVAQAALNDETRRMGISIGDENLRDQILGIQSFQGVDGEFDREFYAFALEQQGLSEAEFEQDIRAETARTLLQAAVVTGAAAPSGYVDAMVAFLAERRSVTWATLSRDDLATGLPVPTEEQLRAYHQSNEARFTTPETKVITYAWLTPDMVLDTVELDEQALREAYEARSEEFNTPEKRLVERLAFADEAAARDALTRIEDGESFDTLVEDRGLRLADVDLGDVSRDDLGAAAETVFDAAAGEVVGPAPSTVGPALYRVNAVLAARQTSFEEAKPLLREDLAADRARRVVDNRIEEIDNLLAGGATIEDLAAETAMQLGQIDWHPDETTGIAAYDSFRRAAAEVTAEDYPEVEQLEDAGIFALRLDDVIPPEVMPLEEVRDAVERGWRRQATVEALRDQAQDYLPQLETGTPFDALGLATESVTDLTRRGFQANTPAGFIDAVFSMQQGDARLLDGAGQVLVLRLDDIAPPDTGNPDVAALRDTIRERASGALAGDLFQALVNDIRQRVGVTIDQQALNAVHSNFQ
ncbi:SurA N-terminal domain-containing protein [Roseovarius sp. SYSU LYC5161]|uniref:SurA N-terminal domain-containing protein n=1 Tax=Roseovarius halophilus (ex Wu et al. 2025) TaxID=3376060 RepID=UPI003999A35F